MNAVRLAPYLLHLNNEKYLTNNVPKENMFSAESKTTPKAQLSPGAGSTTGQKVFFNGYVIRKSGPNTAWANQKKLDIGNDNKNFRMAYLPG